MKNTLLTAVLLWIWASSVLAIDWLTPVATNVYIAPNQKIPFKVDGNKGVNYGANNRKTIKTQDPAHKPDHFYSLNGKSFPVNGKGTKSSAGYSLKPGEAVLSGHRALTYPLNQLTPTAGNRVQRVPGNLSLTNGSKKSPISVMGPVSIQYPTIYQDK